MDEDSQDERVISIESNVGGAAETSNKDNITICNQLQLSVDNQNNESIACQFKPTMKFLDADGEDVMGQNDAPILPISLGEIVQTADDNEDAHSNDLSDFCRICHDVDTIETLITPCRCKGTLSMVHRSCLERWLAASDSSNCELCGQFYITLRTPRYRYIPSIFNWLRSEESCRDVRELMMDVMALCLFTPMALLGTYLGLFAAENFYLTEIDPTRRDITSARLVTLIVMSLMATIDLAYVSWLTVRTQYHVHQWYSWWRRQCTVKLFMPDELLNPTNNNSDKNSEIIVTSQHESLQVNSNQICSSNTSDSSRNLLRDDSLREVNSSNCLSSATLSDIYKIALHDPSRVESWCRICQESKSEVLVSPCRCRGTQGLVHLKCLERWLTVSGTTTCEVCFFPYCVKTVPRYSPFISIFVWIYREGNKKFMACDMVVLLFLTASLMLMTKLAWRHLNKTDNLQYLTPRVGLLAVVFIAYVYLVYSTMRFYYRKWVVWHKTNQQGLRVILPQDCRIIG